MALVKISNGVVTNIVSRAAYEEQFKKLGFDVVEDSAVVQKPAAIVVPDVEEIPEPEEVADEPVDVPEEQETSDDFVEELLEKPISQWTNDELKEFVKIKDIDTSSVKKTSEVRNIVKKYLEEEAKKAATEE